MRLTTEKQLRAAKPDKLTPNDSPAKSPETQALNALQFYLDGDIKNEINALFVLMNALDLLHDEGIIAPKLAESLARGICQSYAQPDQPPGKPKTTTTVMISMEIEGDADDAFHVVDALLDDGVLQDAINDYEGDVGEIQVVSAVSL